MSHSNQSEYRHKWILDEDLRVLVIDDDPILREFATVYLAAPGVEVVTAENGQAGLAMLADAPFDIALVDIDMPVLNGFDVIERVRADPQLARLPLIIVTSNEDMATIDRAYEMGADSFVIKPVNWRLLSYQIRFVLRANKALAA